MPNLRPIALIGLVSAAAAIAPTAFKFEGTPRLDRPKVHSVIVRRDTIWFCARAYPNDHATAFAFVRRSRKWLDGRRSARCEREAKKPFRDTLYRGGRGVLIHVSRPAADSDGAVNGRSFLIVSDSARKRRITLRPHYTAAQIKALEAVGDVDQDTTSVAVRDVIVNDSLIWIGLWGGFPEGEGALGGVYRINRRTGAWRHIVDSTLSWHAVNGLAEVAGTLWIATEQPAEYGAFGNAGLLRMRTRTTRWTGFTDRNSPLPDALIQDVGADSRVVAAATEKGLAVGEIGSKGEIVRWNVRHYLPTFVGDSLVMKLADSSAAVSEPGEAPFLFVQRFGAAGRERALFEVVRKADPDSLLAMAAEYPPNARRLLADVSALPALATLLSGGRESQTIAADGLLQINAPTPSVLPAVRAAFQAVDTATTELRLWSNVRAQLGQVLNRSNDSTGLLWARATLDRARRDQRPVEPVRQALWNYNIAAAARIAGDAKDDKTLPSILAVAPFVSRESRGDLFDAILAFHAPSAWQAALGLVDGGYVDHDRLMIALASTLPADSALRQRVGDIVVQTLADSNAETRRKAVVAARKIRLAGTVPILIQALDRERRFSWMQEELLATLVSLTGRADSPGFSGDMPRAAMDWWNSLLTTSAGVIPVVSAEDGERAMSDWTRRRRIR